MYYIGIDVGGTNIKAGLVDEEGTVLCRAQTPTLAQRPGEEIGADIGRLAKAVAEDSGVPHSEIHSVGIGMPGACSDETGCVLYTANINFSRFPLREAVQKEIRLPVHLGNDANCAALGEYYMLPEKTENLVFITLGTGVGGGLIIGGKLYTGFNGIAGEVGHIMLRHGGEACGCGRRGCWEAYASVTALIRQTRAFAEAHPESAVAKSCGENFEHLSGKTAFALARQGDTDAAKIVETWIGYVADGIVDMINIFQPRLLLIGGAISREGDMLLQPLRQIVEAEMYKSRVPQTEIRIAALGNDAGLIGAAFLGKQS
ncbi:MAG: ROK family protein [Ruminococcaceae bacterium]|nr:ROK family protein [Oscillospiraceae bacterium]